MVISFDNVCYKIKAKKIRAFIWCLLPKSNFRLSDSIICKLINEFYFARPGSSLLRTGCVYLWEQGLLSSCGAQASPWGGLSRCRAWVCGLQLFWPVGSVVVACRLSCPAACGIVPDQGSNPWLLNWQEDSLPLSHQGSPSPEFLTPRNNFVFRHQVLG